MAASPAAQIEIAATHLLSLLEKRGSLQYSTEFYDGTDETHDKLSRALGLDDDWYSAEGLVDLAIVQLQEQGVVECEKLEERLADDEQDFVIRWAEDGRRIAQGGLRFRDMD